MTAHRQRCCVDVMAMYLNANRTWFSFFSPSVVLYLVMIYRASVPGNSCVPAVVIVIHNTKWAFGVVKLWCDVSIFRGDVRLPLILHSNKSVVHCLHFSPFITIFDGRHVQRIQVSPDQTSSSSSRSRFVNEIKGVTVVTDGLVSWFWGVAQRKGRQRLWLS